MRIKLILAGAVIAFAGGVGATVAFAQEFEYAGPSDTVRDGFQGYFTYHDDCAAAFKGSTWCTSEMIITGGRSATAPDPDVDGEWVIPVFTVAPDGTVADFSGATSQGGASGPTGQFNCDGWATGGVAFTGLGIRTNVVTGNDSEVVFLACGDVRKAACCTRAKKN